MRIGIDCRMITHPGIGTYIKGLLDEFSKINVNFILFGNKNDLKDYSNIKIVEFTNPIYSLSEQLVGPKIFKDIDLLHVPHFNIPLSYKGKLVVTIHDLIYLFDKKYSLRNIYTNFMIKNCLKKANKIITVSQNTKNDLEKYFPNVDSSKIDIIYEAARPIFRKISDLELLNKTKNKYNLPNKFILYVGSIKKHKNLQTLINSYVNIKNRIEEKLVLVGRFDKKERALMQKIRREEIVYLGEIPTDDLVCVYNLANLFVMPSIYEGFGLPVLEAFSCGIPVISSNAASLQEIVGNAGILINPFDEALMAESILKLLQDNELIKKLIQNGFTQSQKFSWGICAKQTLEIYKNAVQN